MADSDVALIRKLELASLEVNALILQLKAKVNEWDAEIGELRLREAGMREIGGSMFDPPAPGTVVGTAFAFYPDSFIGKDGIRYEITPEPYPIGAKA